MPSNESNQHILVPDSYKLTCLDIQACVLSGHTLQWKNYSIEALVTLQNSREENAHFVIFQRIGQPNSASTLQRDPDTLPKSHINISPDNLQDDTWGDASYIQKAFTRIISVLNEHQVQTFKMILPAHVPAFIAEGQYGKIFTIYWQDPSVQKQNEVKVALERALSDIPRSHINATQSKRQDRATRFPHITDAAYRQNNFFCAVRVELTREAPSAHSSDNHLRRKDSDASSDAEPITENNPLTL